MDRRPILACLGVAACVSLLLATDPIAAETAPSPTAAAAPVADKTSPTPDFAARRMAELDFLPAALRDEAQRLKSELRDHGGAERQRLSWVPDEVLSGEAGQLWIEARQTVAASLETGEPTPAAWLKLARAATEVLPDDYRLRDRLADEAVSAAVNAHLVSETDAERAKALADLGRVLSDRRRWMDAIRAFRASLALADNRAVRSLYMRTVAQHGFRIVDHEVDSDAASPRICVVFSRDLPRDRTNLSDFVTVEGGTGLAIEADGTQICVEGVTHGARYKVGIREGLPSADGDELIKGATLDLYVRDRAAAVRFPGNAYILPAGGEPTVPVVTINADRIEAELFRIGDRQLARTIGDGEFLSQMAAYATDVVADRTGERIWRGTVEVEKRHNADVVTAIPVHEIAPEAKPGVYVMTARTPNDTQSWNVAATQWFVVTDLGLTTLAGDDGLHVVVRSLSTAEPIAGAKLRLVAVNNDVLGEATGDSLGYARFAPGLMRGKGGNAPGLLVAETSAGDYSFLDLTKPALDLTDRGVDGRAPPRPLDVYLVTERGIYRPGDQVHVTALLRDARARAEAGIPLTLTILRPDGKEHDRTRLDGAAPGGAYTAVPMPPNAMRGTWRLRVHTDPEAAPIAETSVLVEDFEPERLDVKVAGATGVLDPNWVPELQIEATYLYGAPAGGLDIEGSTTLKPTRELANHPGYLFGLAEDPPQPVRESFSGGTTDPSGKATLRPELPAIAGTTQPLEADIAVQIIDTSGRPVERIVTLPVADSHTRIGLKPLFEGAVENGGTASFNVIAVDAAGEQIAVEAVAWQLFALRTDYQYFHVNGRWSFEKIETRRQVASGTLDLLAAAPGRLDLPVEWGRYTVEVAPQTMPEAAASATFNAGWYVEPKTAETPDILKLSLDKERYRVGETAEIGIEPHFAGLAEVLVVDDRMIARRLVRVPAEGTVLRLPVTEDWGAGAYVTAALYRPMDLKAKRMPARALGLAWASIDPGARRLELELSASDRIRPRQATTVDLALPGLSAGEDAYVTLAAVDLGILNLTGHKAPAPVDWYFGQRRLGVELRDVYGQLIDRMQGVRGAVRSGGDAMPGTYEGPPPAGETVAFHSGIVRVGSDGKARIEVPVPDFNGTLRLMAMAWTKTGVGQAATDVVVRDPVVVSAAYPRQLAPGDRSRIAIDLDNVEGVAGPMTLSLSTTGDVVSLGGGTSSHAVDLAEGERRRIEFPLDARSPGDAVLTAELRFADGRTLVKDLGVTVRSNEPDALRRSVVTLQPGATMSLDAEAFAGFVPGSGVMLVAASGAGAIDVPGLIRSLDQYPYGCAEQLTSRALPLVYLDRSALVAGLGRQPDIAEKVDDAVRRILSYQRSDGSFSLWGNGGPRELWLDAYVTDFLDRARERNFDVPDQALTLALDNLQNALAYTGNVLSDGDGVAYALYVLARSGRAAIGDLRYYFETRFNEFTSPLAKAQLGAALALYGEELRADKAFATAVSTLSRLEGTTVWRGNFGSRLRDGAAIVRLASETRRSAVELPDLISLIDRELAESHYVSTQEQAWSLLAADALMRGDAMPPLEVDGAEARGPLYLRRDSEGLRQGSTLIANRGARPVKVTVTTTGTPATPEPASGNGYDIDRAYFTLDGERVDPSRLVLGDRLVAVLTVFEYNRREGRLVIDDPLPAGLAIDNPHLLSSGELLALPGLSLERSTAHVEFRADRFVAALEADPDRGRKFQFAYVVRAVAPGRFAHPAAIVEDMYRPELRARTASGTIEIAGPQR